MSIKTGTLLFNLFSFKSLILAMALVASFGLVQAQRLMDDFKPIIKSAPFMRAMDIDSNGKIYLGGAITMVGQNEANDLIRLSEDGSLDMSFNHAISSSGTISQIITSEDSVVLLVKEGEKMIVLKKDGTPDPSFELTDYLFNIWGAGIIDDKYLVVGQTLNSGLKLVRLNRDGSRDESFETSGFEITYAAFFQYLAQPDKKIIFAGDITLDNGEKAGIIRLNQDGSLDESFAVFEGFTGSITDLDLQTDGKIVLTGAFNGFDGTPTTAGIVRLESNGLVDAGFLLAPSSSILSSNAYQTEITENDKLIIVGHDYDPHPSIKLFQLNEDGAIDDQFPVSSLTHRGSADILNLKIKEDGQIVLAGHFTHVGSSSRQGFAVFNENGSLKNVDPKLGKPAWIKDAILQMDGRILLAGDFYSINGEEIFGIARLNADGSIDNSFQVDIDFSDYLKNRISSIALQSDGKILAGGYFTKLFSEFTSPSLLRLNPDGKHDETFIDATAPAFVDDGITNILTTDEDKILISGTFSTKQGETKYHHAKLNANGSVDLAYNTDNIFPQLARVNTMAFFENEELVIVGDLFNATSVAYGLNNIGEICQAYSTEGVQQTYFYDILYTGNDLIVSGYYNGGGTLQEDYIPIHKFEPSSGSLVTVPITISRSKGGYAGVGSMISLSGEEIIIAGGFDKVNSLGKSGIAKVDLSGNVDDQFTFDADNGVDLIIREDAEHIIAFGPFKSINNHTVPGIARIKITNEIPEIIGSATTITTELNRSLILLLSDILVEDGDDSFPNEFTLTIQEGENYLVGDDNAIIPTPGFIGTLMVPIYVNDGKDDSPIFNLEITVTPITGIAPSELGTELRIFPNPTSSNLSVEFQNKQRGLVSFIFYDLAGKLILRKYSQKTSDELSQSIDVSSLEKGMYIMKLRIDENLLVSKRVVIE